jgi:hypothetical protein
MPECSVDSILTAQACFKNFNSEERKSLLIVFNAFELAAAGGTDYTEQLGSGGTLMDDATCYLNLDLETCPPPLPYLVFAYNNAVAAGATPPSTTVAQATAIECNKNFTPAQKDAQLAWLACQLGSHTGD